MRMTSLLSLSTALVLAASPATAQPKPPPQGAMPLSSTIIPAATKATADIVNNSGKSIGSAEFTQGTEGVLIRIKASDLPAGVHGMHFHEIGDCSDHAKFQHAKGHIMPDGKPHGYLNPKGPHAGNLPNLIVHKDGTVETEVYTQLVSVAGQKGAPALLDKDGSSLMIHTSEDDHTSQPIGNSGDRIACGVVKAKP